MRLARFVRSVSLINLVWDPKTLRFPLPHPGNLSEHFFPPLFYQIHFYFSHVEKMVLPPEWRAQSSRSHFSQEKSLTEAVGIMIKGTAKLSRRSVGGAARCGGGKTLLKSWKVRGKDSGRRRGWVWTEGPGACGKRALQLEGRQGPCRRSLNFSDYMDRTIEGPSWTRGSHYVACVAQDAWKL